MTVEPENNLDRFIQNELDRKSFEFNPAHWEAAKKMIDENQKKKRRGVFYWRTFGGIMLATISLYLIYNSVELPSGKVIADTPEDIIINHTKLNGNEVADTPINLISTASAPQLSYSNQFSDPGPLGAKSSATERNKIPSELSTTRSYPSAQINKNDARPSNHDVKTSLLLTSETKLTKTTLKNVLSAENYRHALIEPGSVTSPTAKAAYERDRKWTKSGIIQNLPKVKFLPLKMHKFRTFIKYSEHSTAQNSDLLQNGRRIKAALHLEGLIAPWDGDRYFAGLRVGVPVKYAFNHRMGFNTGVFYHQLHRMNLNTRLKEQITYDFGSQSQYFVMSGHTAHTLQLPLEISYYFGRHEIYTGYLAEYLLGLQGNILEVTLMPSAARSRKVQEILHEVQNGWLDMTPLHQIQHELILGYNYNLNSGLESGMNIYYRLNNLLRSPPDLEYREPGRLHAGFYLRLNF